MTSIACSQAVPLHRRPNRLSGWRLTREGWLCLLIVIVLLAIGIVKNINLLALLGYVVLAALALSGLVVGRSLRRLEARRQLEEQHFANTWARVEVRIRNPHARPCPGVCLEDNGTLHERSWYFDRVEGHSRHDCTAELILPRRGWYDFAPLTASTRYPFGLVQRRVLIGPPVRILVLPRPGKLSRERLRQYLRGSDPHGERVHRRGWRHETAQAEFHGLRPFRPGDSPRWIHWRTSARRGELMVREFEDVPGDDLVCILDTRCSSPEAFESLVSLTAAVVVLWCERRGDRLVLVIAGPKSEIHDGLSGPEHGAQLLASLALVTCASPGDSIDLDLGEEHVPVTAALLVTSSGASDLPDVLRCTTNRPVAHLDVQQRHQWGFYTEP